MKCPNCQIELVKEGDISKCQKCIFESPKNTLKIDEMFAFISVDEQGNEGICAVESTIMGRIPMVGADFKRMKQLEPFAEKLASAGYKIVLAYFGSRKNIKTYD